MKLPPPPPGERLVETNPEWALLAKGSLLWRIHPRAGDHPMAWASFRRYGPVNARFDHHLPPPREQSRAIYYAARDWRSCIAEVFQVGRRVNPEADSPALVGFRLAREVRLLDLSGRWATRMGASMAIHTGRHDRARAWSRALYEAFPGAQGLLCCSSMDSNRHTVVLYERARGAMPPRPAFHRPLSDPEIRPMLEEAAAELGYMLS